MQNAKLDSYDCFVGDHITFLPEAEDWYGITYPHRVLVTEDLKTQEEVERLELRIAEILHALGRFLPQEP